MHALLGLDFMPLLAQEASATYLRYITGGGVVGYVILGLSVIAVALGLAQLVHVRAASLAPASLMEDVNTMASQGQFGRALERLKLADADCFAGRVLRAGLKRASQGPLGPLEARSAMEDAGGEESMQLEQRLDWLAAIANIATLLGLLGTVQGMIGAFETVASSAVNDSGYYQRLAENISIALITTFQGLCVAIPCIALHTFLRTRLTRIVALVGDECDRVVAELERHAAKSRGGRT